MQQPVPFDEGNCKDKFWKEDPFDKFIPKRKGFITDCIYRYRGTEIPTIYTVWSSLVALSMAIKRDAWLQFGYQKKYCNLYVILVGQAGIAKKSTTISYTTKLLRNFPKIIPDRCLREIKQFVQVSNKITPEGLVDVLREGRFLLPGGVEFPITLNKKPVIDEDGCQKIYHRPCEQLIEIPELAVMLGKQSYMEGMVSLLMDIYDNHDYWEYKTKNSSPVKLVNLYTCLLGATTPNGFRDSIPSSARGDGFLTRTILVYVPRNYRSFPIPNIPDGAPSDDELSKRLAYIAMNTSGEYILSNEASEYYINWYNEHKKRLNENPDHAGINSRLDHNLLKVALLLKANTYESGREISKDDLEEADKLISNTSLSARKIIDQVASGEYGEWLNRVDDLIKAKGKVSRRELLRHFTGRLKQRELDEYINRLRQEGVLKVTNQFGKVNNGKLSPNGTDIYTYLFE